MAGEPQRNHRATAIAVSIAAHAVATGLLVWRMGTAPPQVEPPVMNVQLANLARHRPANVARAPPRDRRPTPIAPSPTPRAAAATPPPQAREANSGPEPAPGAPPAVAPTLRALLGCEHARLLDLSAEERERCRDRLAAEGARARGTQAARLNLDRRGDFTANPETYLNRIPTKGCKPRVAGDVAPGPGRSGGPQGPEAGATCVIPF
jgi:hypothetical protein